MYQVQIQDALTSEWVAVGEPTLSFPRANFKAHELRENTSNAVRVACVDDLGAEA
jgi:hypothetical protein